MQQEMYLMHTAYYSIYNMYVIMVACMFQGAWQPTYDPRGNSTGLHSAAGSKTAVNHVGQREKGICKAGERAH
jgi:hypothetical protein